MHLATDIQIRNGVTGGLVIGAASTFFLLLTGRITGLSGIFEGVIIRRRGEKSKMWVVSYSSGLICSGIFLGYYYPAVFGVVSNSQNKYILCASGILTGFGTRLGSGCTSGHGVCGLPRFSLRSLVAVASFMATGAVSAALSGRIGGVFSGSVDTQSNNLHIALPSLVSLTGSSLIFAVRNSELSPDMTLIPSVSAILGHVASFGCAFLLGIGLGVSGMCDPDRVKMFLDFSGVRGWDPTLMGVMGGGVLFNLITFHTMKSLNIQPMLNADSDRLGKVIKIGNVPENTSLNWKLVAGSAIFGVGWGLGGVCPGPALVSLGASIESAGLFIPSMIAGMVLQELLFAPIPSFKKQL